MDLVANRNSCIWGHSWGTIDYNTWGYVMVLHEPTYLPSLKPHRTILPSQTPPGVTSYSWVAIGSQIEIIDISMAVEIP